VSEVPPPLESVDSRLAAWVAWLLEKAPEARPDGAAEAWHALEEIVVDIHGPYWRRTAAIAADEEAPTELVPSLPAGEGATTDTLPRGTVDGTRFERAPVAADRPRRRRLGAVAAAAAAIAGAAAAVLVIGGDDPPGGDQPSGPAPPASAVEDRARGVAPFDFDGDGRPTLVAGRPGQRSAGVVAVDRERTLTPSDPQAGEAFGAALASADFDRDGSADLAVGAPEHNTGGRSEREAP